MEVEESSRQQREKAKVEDLAQYLLTYSQQVHVTGHCALFGGVSEQQPDDSWP